MFGSSRYYAKVLGFIKAALHVDDRFSRVGRNGYLSGEVRAPVDKKEFFHGRNLRPCRQLYYRGGDI